MFTSFREIMPFRKRACTARLLIIVPIAVFTAALLLTIPTAGKSAKSVLCKTCHVIAPDVRYPHTVVRDDCTICHTVTEAEPRTVVRSHSFHRRMICYLDIPHENEEHQVRVVLTDRNGSHSEPKTVSAVPRRASEYGKDKDAALKEMFGIKLEEIRKGILAEATISWITDAPAISEVEYAPIEEHMSTAASEDLFSTNHKITLSGLKHKKKYHYRIISRDLLGNTLKSQEYTFDTSDAFTLTREVKSEDERAPSINEVKAFRVGGKEGLYLQVVASKPSRLTVDIKEIRHRNAMHSFRSLPGRYTRIDACVQCHPQDASHPVGIKAVGPNISAPRNLPTIEGGVITCVTCHYPHGGERAYFFRMDSEDKLCQECHSGDVYKGGSTIENIIMRRYR